jgi:phenylpyruvate tautomerase PptA (4-oxalocrotonate tautomerase family)
MMARRSRASAPSVPTAGVIGTLTAEDKKKIVERTTDLYAEIYGERARPNTVVLVDEVVNGLRFLLLLSDPRAVRVGACAY